MYDVLHDADYRRCWDDNMLECFEICQLDRYNDIGYYSSKSICLCPDLPCNLVPTDQGDQVQVLLVLLCSIPGRDNQLLHSLPGVFQHWQVCLGSSILTSRWQEAMAQYYYMDCVCSRNNGHSDWLILGHYSPVMPTSRLWVYKIKAKSHTINNLLTSNVQSLWENLKCQPCRIDLVITQSMRQCLCLRFSC